MQTNHPIFLHAGFRTGGTALAFAFRELSNYRMFYDPLSTLLEARKLDYEPNSWNSNHPNSYPYFKEYKEFIDEYLNLVPSMHKLRFDFSGTITNKIFFEAISYLISQTERESKQAVFKFETSEGRIAALRDEFPNGIHIGLIRNAEDQQDSWDRMRREGEYGFYYSAWKLIASNKDDFKKQAKISYFLNSLNTNEIFQIYEGVRRSKLKSCDLVIDISKPSDLKKLDKLLDLDSAIASQLERFKAESLHRSRINKSIQREQVISHQPDRELSAFFSKAKCLLKRSYLASRILRLKGFIFRDYKDVEFSNS